MEKSQDQNNKPSIFKNVSLIRAAFTVLQKELKSTAVYSGWMDDDCPPERPIAKAMSELGEALESFRNGNPGSDQCPGFLESEIELADAIIMIFDCAIRNDLRLAEAILAKNEFNKTRGYKHGKKF